MGKSIIFTGKETVQDFNNDMLRFGSMVVELYRNGNGNDYASFNVRLGRATTAIISTNGQFTNGATEIQLSAGINTITAKINSGTRAIIQILNAENNLNRIDGGSIHTLNSPTFIINLNDIVASLTEIETTNSVNLAGDINDVALLQNMMVLSCEMPEASTAFTATKGISGVMRTSMPQNLLYIRILGNQHTFDISTEQTPQNAVLMIFTCRYATMRGDIINLSRYLISACSIRFKNNPSGLLSNLPPTVTSWAINTSNLSGTFGELNTIMDGFTTEGNNSLSPSGDLSQLHPDSRLAGLSIGATDVSYSTNRTWKQAISLYLPNCNMNVTDLDRLFNDLDNVISGWSGKSIIIRGTVSSNSQTARNSLIGKGASITIYNV